MALILFLALFSLFALLLCATVFILDVLRIAFTVVAWAVTMVVRLINNA